MDVGHLGAADALVDPAHDITENALRIVVEFALDLVRRPVRPHGHRHREDVVELCLRPALQRHLDGMHIDLVVVRGVQRRRGRRRHPGGVGASLGMGDLLFQHRRHQVGHRPHALADLGVAGQAAFEPGVDIPRLIGGNPGGLLHVALADHRAGFHRGVDLVAGAVEEAGVDEHHALLRRGSHSLRLTVVRRSSSMMPILMVFLGMPSKRFDAVEDLDGEGDFLRPVHLRLHDIHRAGAGVHAPALRCRHRAARSAPSSRRP